MYHVRVTSLKVLDISLHFKESKARIITICMLMEAICSYGSLRPSNLENEDGLKFSNTPISHQREVRDLGF